MITVHVSWVDGSAQEFAAVEWWHRHDFEIVVRSTGGGTVYIQLRQVKWFSIREEG